MSWRAWFCGALVGCTIVAPGGGKTSDGGLEQGYTACGLATCAPGQYCINQQGGFCTDGCVSNENCLDGYLCDVDPVLDYGSCQPDPDQPPDSTTPTTPVEPADPLQACLDAIDVFQGCGLSSDLASAMRDACRKLSEDQQHAVAGCADLSCDDAAPCIGLECLSEDQCGSGETCLDGFCVN